MVEAQSVKTGELWETISISDHIGNLKIYEIINRCTGKQYRGWMKAWYDINDDYALWFPKIATRQQVADMKAYGFKGHNLLSADGKELMQADPTKDLSVGNAVDPASKWAKTRIVFGRVNGSFRFLGIFVPTYQPAKNLPYWSEIYKRVGTEINLRTFQYRDI